MHSHGPVFDTESQTYNPFDVNQIAEYTLFLFMSPIGNVSASGIRGLIGTNKVSTGFCSRRWASDFGE